MRISFKSTMIFAGILAAAFLYYNMCVIVTGIDPLGIY